MILLCCARLPEGLDKSTLAELVRAKLPNKANAEYINALEQKKNDLSACESLYAMSLLCDMTAHLPTPTDTSSLILERGEFGKPYFLNSTLKFNLSHSRGIVACALSDSDEVGVDVEAALPTDDRAIKIAERFFDPHDMQAIENDPNSFAHIWSENEAEAKFFGISLAEFLKNKRNSDQNSKNIQLRQNTATHRFSFCNIPVTLCTSRDFSTIFFNFRA